VTITQLAQHVRLRVAFLAGGIGGVAKGFKDAKGTFMMGDMPVSWEYEIAGSIDNNAVRNREFERLMSMEGVAHTIDLFTRAQWIAFHSKTKVIHDPALTERLDNAIQKCVHPDGLINLDDQRYWRFDDVWARVDEWVTPPPGWQEFTPDDLVRLFGDDLDVVFASMPCQGNSRLKSEADAAELPSRALNGLVPRAFYLVALAPFKTPVKVMFSENVPGIKYRSKHLLEDMRRSADQMDYETHHGDHDTGKVCGAPQSRPRHFWTQRHRQACPPFLYKPQERPLASIMDYLGDKPMPGDPAGGRNHACPNLDFLTWLRLALIRPGGDWKDIPGPGHWQLRTFDGRIVPPEAFCKLLFNADGTPKLDKNGKQRLRWFWPDPAVWGKVFVAELLPGAMHYADVRLHHRPMGNGHGAYWVQDVTQPSGTVTADPSHRKSGGASTVADTRLQADPRCPDKADRHASHMRVTPPDGQAGAVTGATHLANGAPSVSDIRLAFRENRHSTKYEVRDSGRPSDVVTTSDRLGSGAPSVADLRVGLETPKFNDAYNVREPDQPSKTVSGGTGPGGGGHSLADPRLTFAPNDGAYGVCDANDPSRAITGATSVTTSNGPGAVADPRIVRHAKGGTMHVNEGADAANTITTATDHNGDAQALADARMTCASRNGTLGVIAWNGPSPAIIASLDVYCGQAAIEDVRVNIHWWPEWFPQGFIISPWNAWHRPLTDWELWILQTFPAYDDEGRPYEIAGSRQDVRQAIGNAVMPLAARAYAEALAPTLIVARLAPDAFLFSPTGGRVWVSGVSLDLPAPPASQLVS